MPELPEVETTLRGIAPHVTGTKITRVEVREHRLRWPVPKDINRRLSGQHIRKVERRAKYLLLHTDRYCLLLHLGMSGSLRIVPRGALVHKHDHVDFEFDSGMVLRLRDPRRFGSVLVINGDPQAHPLLKNLGPEPLEDNFNGAYLYQRSSGRTQAVKSFLMDSRNVVGIGNIYASEALFCAGISPKRRAGAVARNRYEFLATAIKSVLRDAIRAGGTTLRDYVAGDGNPGYFERELQVYGRAGLPCPRCRQPIRQIRQGQRSTFYCSRCQR